MWGVPASALRPRLTGLRAPAHPHSWPRFGGGKKTGRFFLDGKKKKNLGSGSRALPPPSSSPAFPADFVRGIRSPSRNLRGRNAAQEGEGGRRGRGIFDVSLSEAVDFHMVEGGGRVCEVGLKSGRLSAPGGGGPGPPTRGCSRGGSQARAGPPRPGQASQGHSPPRRWPPQCAPRPPSPSCPPGSPRAGGGNRRQRPDSASLAAGSSGGGVGLGGKERATRCVGQRSSGQSVTPRGSRAGVGRAGGIRAPRRPGGAARTVWCPRLGGGRPAWEGLVTPGGKWGLGLCPRTFPKVRSPRPIGARAPGPDVPGDGAGPPGGAVGGEASRSARLELELFESQLPPFYL